MRFFLLLVGGCHFGRAHMRVCVCVCVCVWCVKCVLRHEDTIRIHHYGQGYNQYARGAIQQNIGWGKKKNNNAKPLRNLLFALVDAVITFTVRCRHYDVYLMASAPSSPASIWDSQW